MKKEIKKPKLIVLIIFIIIGLSAAQLVISHRLATAGGKMRQLEEKISRIENDNKRLSEEINQMGSLSLISKTAQELGLVKAKSVLHLTPQIPVALETVKADLER